MVIVGHLKVLGVLLLGVQQFNRVGRFGGCELDFGEAGLAHNKVCEAIFVL